MGTSTKLVGSKAGRVKGLVTDGYGKVSSDWNL